MKYSESNDVFFVRFECYFLYAGNMCLLYPINAYASISHRYYSIK